MDLKSFAEKENTQKTSTSNLNEADVKRAIKHFGGMSNDQLMRELSRHISAKKRAGKEDEVYNILERIKPFLSDEQRKRLAEIMGSIG